ncbi:MAG: TatD family hydrolase [Acutalibacteraceae bacterium]|nr:TatD family hydrolase [Acutalibacteraceae bacterium]
MTDILEECPLSEPLIFDSHAHYDDAKFDKIRDELLEALPSHGVCGVINCGCDTSSSKTALAFAEKYPYFYAAVGVHPENIGGGNISEIEELASHKKCIAIGEIGLDYYWVSDNKEEQKALFEEQLILANKLVLPVIVHDREAHGDTLELLKKHRPRGVVHSFSGSPEMAKEILNIGMYIGIGGVITFKNAKKLPEVVAQLPEDRFLLETDAPYLTPVPYRGEVNHSAMIYYTAKKVAEIRNTTIENVLDSARKNTEKLFNI